MKPSPRGFSLVEMVVALAMGVALATAATGVLIVARRSATEAAQRAAMVRDGQLVMDTLERDLSFLGTGLPKDTNSDVGTPASGKDLFPAVRRGLDQNLVFVGDLPYPNAEVPGIAAVSRIADPPSNDLVAVTSEVSGACSPPNTGAAVGFQCKTTTTSLVPGVYTAADDCNSAQRNARTCPWAMNKWEPGGGSDIFFTFVSANGHWFERKVNGLIPSGSLTLFDESVGINLKDGFPTAGQEKLKGSDFFNPVGSGYIAQMDRVFWALEDPGTPGSACATTNCTLYRRQCWGQLKDPGNANFPNNSPGNTFYGFNKTPIDCAPGALGDGTPWETIATGISSFKFTYYKDASGTALATPLSVADQDAVRAIELDLTFTRKIKGSTTTVTQNLKRRYFINNRRNG